MQMPTPDAGVIARRGEIAAALRRIVSPEAVIDSEPARRVYESDGLTAYRQSPLVAVLLLFGILVILAQFSTVAPFIYTLF